MRPAEYTPNVSATHYVRPVHPGTLVIPPGTTQHEGRLEYLSGKLLYSFRASKICSVDALGEHTLVGCLLSFGTVGADSGLAVSFTSFVVAPCTLAPCGTASGLLWVSFYQVFHFMYAFFDPTSVPQSSR